MRLSAAVRCTVSSPDTVADATSPCSRLPAWTCSIADWRTVDSAAAPGSRSLESPKTLSTPVTCEIGDKNLRHYLRNMPRTPRSVDPRTGTRIRTPTTRQRSMFIDSCSQLISVWRYAAVDFGTDRGRWHSVMCNRNGQIEQEPQTKYARTSNNLHSHEWHNGAIMRVDTSTVGMAQFHTTVQCRSRHPRHCEEHNTALVNTATCLCSCSGNPVQITSCRARQVDSERSMLEIWLRTGQALLQALWLQMNLIQRCRVKIKQVGSVAAVLSVCGPMY